MRDDLWVGVKGQLCGVSFLPSLSMVSRDQIVVIQLAWQEPLPMEPS